MTPSSAHSAARPAEGAERDQFLDALVDALALAWVRRQDAERRAGARIGHEEARR